MALIIRGHNATCGTQIALLMDARFVRTVKLGNMRRLIQVMWLKTRRYQLSSWGE
jgi:hypothetical protein